MNARRRVKRVQELLARIGLDEGRVRMFDISSAMAGQFAAAATEMTEQVAALGPSPLRNQEVGGTS